MITGGERQDGIRLLEKRVPIPGRPEDVLRLNLIECLSVSHKK